MTVTRGRSRPGRFTETGAALGGRLRCGRGVRSRRSELPSQHQSRDMINAPLVRCDTESESVTTHQKFTSKSAGPIPSQPTHSTPAAKAVFEKPAGPVRLDPDTTVPDPPTGLLEALALYAGHRSVIERAALDAPPGWQDVVVEHGQAGERISRKHQVEALKDVDGSVLLCWRRRPVAYLAPTTAGTVIRSDRLPGLFAGRPVVSLGWGPLGTTRSGRRWRERQPIGKAHLRQEADRLAAIVASGELAATGPDDPAEDLPR